MLFSKLTLTTFSRTIFNKVYIKMATWVRFLWSCDI